ncbi:MAG: S8 family peptidase [bacterium]|nr:S8 family peptidase [bacterium]
MKRGNRELDPKLLRLIESAKSPKRLRADLDRGIVSSTIEFAEDEEVSAEDLNRRVLVQLTQNQPPEGFGDLRWNKIVDTVFAVDVPILRLPELARSKEVRYVEAGRDMAPTLNNSVPETRANDVHNSALGLDGSDVVVGIIDFGFDFTLDDFRDDNGKTRVAFLWDQTLTSGAGEVVPQSFGYGVEYDRDRIDAALNTQDPFSTVRHKPSPGSHGTHVAGTAVGNGRSGDSNFPANQFIGTAPGAAIVYVQPDSTDQDTTFADSVNVAEAIAYVFEKADELNLPCVINMSLGQNGGSHDGESVVERAIDRLLEQPGRAMVVAAGNEHIWRGHSSGQLNDGDSRSLRWKYGGQMPIPSGAILGSGYDYTPNEMELWYSSRDLFSVRVLDPNGEQTAFVGPGETEVHTFQSGDVAFIDSERFTVLNGESRVYIEVSSSGPGKTVLSGEWQVEIEAGEVRDGHFDVWIERDARRHLNNYADQSFFVGTDFVPEKTLGTPATMRRGVAVANYDHVAQAPNDSSGRGTTRDGRYKPEVAAPGTNIMSSNARGGTADPNAPGSNRPMRIQMSGTSMSAPHVSGIVALLLQHDSTLTADQIRKILIASASPPAGVQPFEPAWGYGRVDAERALSIL